MRSHGPIGPHPPHRPHPIARAARTTAGREVEWQDLTLPFSEVQEDGSQQVLIMSDFGAMEYRERVTSLDEALGAPRKAEFIQL